MRKPYAGIKLMLMAAVSACLRVGGDVWVIRVFLSDFGRGIIMCLCTGAPEGPGWHCGSRCLGGRRSDLLAPGEKVCVRRSPFMCRVFRPSSPYHVLLIPPLQSPHPFTNSSSWVTSHDTHTDTPSISHSDFPLLVLGEVCARVCVCQRDLDCKLDFEFKDGWERERISDCCVNHGCRCINKI